MSEQYRSPMPPPPPQVIPPPPVSFAAVESFAEEEEDVEHTMAVEGMTVQQVAMTRPLPPQFSAAGHQGPEFMEDATGVISNQNVTLPFQSMEEANTAPAYGMEKPSPMQRRPRPAHGITLESLVREAFENDFSDIHLGVGEVPRFRDRGRLEPSDHPVTDDATFAYWLEEILTPEQIQRFHHELEYDGATQYEGMARVRINVFVSLNGPAMVLRLIPLRIKTIDELSLPMIFRDLCHYHKGLILVTGPTGSGKSTTMAAMVDYINSEMPKHIISIEDPVEFVHQSKRAMIRQREVGIHTTKFDNALKASLREDPDVILIGEMRDRETVNTALKAAQTGHLVFGTLHTNSAVKTIERILNLYNPEEQGPMRVQVAESLVGVIAQSLVRTTDGKRAAIHEIMINTDAVKDYILRGEVESIEQLIPQCTYDGMMTMNQCLYDLYEIGRIDEETALEASPKPNEMSQILRGRV
jgi:twitching motility protein PilT